MLKHVIKTVCVLQFALLSHGFKIQPRVINGQTANPLDFPFFAHIVEGDKTCGGALISDRWIITAAHCIQENIPIDVIFGGGRDLEHFVVYPWEYYFHPLFDEDFLFNDIGLIKLNKTIKSASYVRPAKIATSIESQAGGERVVGVGAGRFSLTKSDVDGIVRYAEFVTMPIKECAEQFKTPFDMASTVCAKTVNGTSMFLGDSGGPLLRRSDKALIGIVSFTNVKHLEEGKDAIQAFTYIPHYYSWIQKITGIDFAAESRQ